jgi:uncharacterized protein DUF664
VDEKTALLAFLEAQRHVVLAILDGLDDDALTTAVLPSGWTPLGMIEHLGYAERHWFQEVLLGAADPVPWPDGEPLRTPRPRDTVFGFYAEQRDKGDAIIEDMPLDTKPKGRHDGEEVDDLRWIILHMIEETARHAGHLDAARELLDGSTGLGAR